MKSQAAVFRTVHEPLTIESVEMDKPWGREVLVRTVATGVCHSDLHVVDGLGRYALDRPFGMPELTIRLELLLTTMVAPRRAMRFISSGRR